MATSVLQPSLRGAGVSTMSSTRPRGGSRLRTVGMTFEETVQAIIEFVEVVIQCILKVRQIYPPESFAQRRKYDLVLWQTRHPGLSQYFGEALNPIREQLLDSPGDSEVGVRLHHRTSDQEYERYTFRIRPLDSNDSATLTRSTLDLHFRSILTRILELEQLPPPGQAQDRTVSLTFTAPDNQVLDTEDWQRTMLAPASRPNLGPIGIETGLVEVQVTGAGVAWSTSQLQSDLSPDSTVSFSRMPLTAAGVRSAGDFGDDLEYDEGD